MFNSGVDLTWKYILFCEHQHWERKWHFICNFDDYKSVDMGCITFDSLNCVYFITVDFHWLKPKWNVLFILFLSNENYKNYYLQHIKNFLVVETRGGIKLVWLYWNKKNYMQIALAIIKNINIKMFDCLSASRLFQVTS